LSINIRKIKAVIIILFSLPVMKLGYLQLVKGQYFSEVAEEQQERMLIIDGERGDILDRWGRVLAMDRNVYSVYANPRMVRNKNKLAKELEEILGVGHDEIMKKLSKNCYFVWLKRGIEDENVVKKIKRFPALGVKIERKRIYPQGKLACHLLGAVDVDNNGIAGLELFYNKKLKGRPGYKLALGDGRNFYLGGFSQDVVPPRDGSNLVLTIDQVIQHYAERIAEKLYNKYQARRVSIVVMNPYNGEVLALANSPNYDPNHITEDDIKYMKNFAITEMFEPGSVFKVIAAAALIDQGLVRLGEKVYCENGVYKIGRRILHDYHRYGWLDFKSVIVHSSNIGVAKFCSRIPDDLFYRYLRLFGVGEKTGIDLPGETSGILRPPENWTGYSKISLAIGQEVAVNTIHLAKMMSIIANGGFDVRPHVVQEIRDSHGMRIWRFNYQPKRLLKPDTAAKLRDILKEAVEKGTGRWARSKVYTIGGKTGTAQKVDLANGGYASGKYTATFVGFLPVEHPRVVIVITVDEPHGSHFGGTVCAPAFKELGERTLVYMNLAQERRVKNETERNFIWN
jgi:cell division protein FtsI (penicillin-binding protein 3)